MEGCRFGLAFKNLDLQHNLVVLTTKFWMRETAAKIRPLYSADFAPGGRSIWIADFRLGTLATVGVAAAVEHHGIVRQGSRLAHRGAPSVRIWFEALK